MKASKSWGKAQSLIQGYIDEKRIDAKYSAEKDDKSLGIATYIVADEENILKDFPGAYWADNYGDPRGGNYGRGLILFPGFHEGEIDVE